MLRRAAAASEREGDRSRTRPGEPEPGADQPADEEAPDGAIAALGIDELLDQQARGEEVDYMHVTIEGAEPRVFEAGGEWPQRVRSLRVELHPYFGFTADRCTALLERPGYRVWPVPEEPEKWIYAVRP